MTGLTDFERALAVTLHFEGGWYPGTLAGDPNPTMKGITQRTYDAYQDKRGAARHSVRDISEEDVRTIYDQRFWLPSGADDMLWPMNLLVFDWAVNSGRRHALAGLGTSGSDPQSYLAARWAFLERLMQKRPATRVFRKGWARRVNALSVEAGVPAVAKEMG